MGPRERGGIDEKENRPRSGWKPWIRDALLVVSTITGLGVAVSVGRVFERLLARQDAGDEHTARVEQKLDRHIEAPSHAWTAEQLAGIRQNISDIKDTVNRIERRNER
jgi:hypothetical protein